MKATGIVRRIDAGVIIGQKPTNRITTGFPLVCPIEHKGIKKRFSSGFYT